MTRTNLHTNPRFGVNITDGCAISGGTRERIAISTIGVTPYPRGVQYACKLTPTTDNVYLYSPTSGGTSCYPCTPGEDITWTWLYCAPDFDANDYVQIRLVFYDINGANAQYHAETADYGKPEHWTPISFTYTTPAGCYYVRADIRVHSTSLHSAYVTQLILEKTSSPGFWFCGATPGYEWDGTADNSTSSGDGLYDFTHPGLLFSQTELENIAQLTTTSPLHRAAWNYYCGQYVTSDTTSHAFAGPVDWQATEDWQTAYFATCASDPRRALAWGYAYHFDPTNATTYATRVRNLLWSWAQVWVPNRVSDCITLSDRSHVVQLGVDQSSILFRFAFAYDLVVADSVWNEVPSGETQTYASLIAAWLRDCAAREWTFLPFHIDWGHYAWPGSWPNDHTMYDYEWRPSTDVAFLQARRSDRFGPAGDSVQRLALATIACAYSGGTYPEVAMITTNDGTYYSLVRSEYVSHYLPYNSLIDHALHDTTEPQNQGDYRDIIGTYAPTHMIPKRPLASGADTTDYITYNARMHAIMLLITHHLWETEGGDGTTEDYMTTHSALIQAQWLYIARLFAPGAVPSPVYDADRGLPDIINYPVNKSRLPLGYAVTELERLRAVSLATEHDIAPTKVYESDYVGPTTLLFYPFYEEILFPALSNMESDNEQVMVPSSTTANMMYENDGGMVPF